jgi:hypothetical protein
MKSFASALKEKYVLQGPKKISKVMREFKAGELDSSSGQKVTSRKQAIAIALNEARRQKK